MKGIAAPKLTLLAGWLGDAPMGEPRSSAWFSQDAACSDGNIVLRVAGAMEVVKSK